MIGKMQEEKRMKVKKGSLAVRVGLGGEDRRFVIPITYLSHPQFNNLLESAREVYGLHTSGPLQLPCSIDDFLHLLWLIEREQNRSLAHHQSHRSSSFSLRAC